MQVQCKPDASAMQSEAKEKKEEKKKKEREKEAAVAAALQNLNEKTEKKGTLSGKVITGTGKPLDEREKAFYNAIAAFKSDYSPEILRAFYDYWRKPTASGTRMQFETIHPSFDIGFRLARWKEHESEFQRKETAQADKLYSYEEMTILVTSGKAKSTSAFERIERCGAAFWRLKQK
jgi:hypothetical protein